MTSGAGAAASVRFGVKSVVLRVTSLLALLMALMLAAATFALARAWQRSMVAAAVSETERFADTIKRSAQYSMLHAQADAVREIINAVGRQPDVDWVRVFNKEGRVIYSTNPAEIGTVLDKSAEACDRCHQSGKPLQRLPSKERSRILEGGHRVLATIDPIFNQAACAAEGCHAKPQAQPVLGVLDVAVSLEPTDRMVRRGTRTLVLFGAGSIVAASALVALFLQIYVGRPVRRLLEATHRVAHGQLEHVIPVDGEDELASLAASFNQMTESLHKTSREIHELNASLEQRVADKTRALSAAEAQVARAERLAAVGRMAAGIAHEINNPLTGVLTFAHLLARDAPQGSRQKADLDTIIRETNRCAGIIRDLLKFSRETPSVRTPCQVNAILAQALPIVEHQAEFHNIAIVRDLDPAIAPILADAGQIEQVFLNIIVNAAQAMPAGGTLTLRTRRREDGVEVTIADTGCGIAPENLSRIFDPFFTTKEPGQGTGLGLAVSHRLIESHGGTIQVASEPGRGARFTIVLPAAPLPAVVAP